MSANIATMAYIAAIILFILSLGGLSNPESSRRGNLYGIVGMAIAVLATVFFLSSLGLTYLGSTRSSAVPAAGKSIMDTQIPKGDVPAVPVAPTGGAPAAPAPAQGKVGEVPK